jgi:hypothetical protein
MARGSANDGVNKAAIRGDSNLKDWAAGEVGAAYEVKRVVRGADAFDSMPPSI